MRPSKRGRLLTDAMLRAFASLKQGPMERQRHAFVAADGSRHHSQVVASLQKRGLAIVQAPSARRAKAVLSPMGAALRPEQEVA